LCGLPGQGVFAAAAADDKYLHGQLLIVTIRGILLAITFGVAMQNIYNNAHSDIHFTVPE
jgi:hypothetical protein